jgi:hypothetical protein
MKRREIGPCRVPHHLGVDVVAVVGAGGVAGTGADVAVAAPVADEPELNEDVRVKYGVGRRG